MPPNTLRKVKGVVGITDIQASYKLSKNREHDHPKIIAELHDRNDPRSTDIAKEMQKKP